MDFSVGVVMTLWRATRAAAVLVLILAWSGCGDTFRPVAVPIPAPPPDPSSFHFVLMIGENGPNNPGSATRIDVSGDSNAGEATVGLGPVHATLLPNGGRIYVANSLEDTVSSYALSNAASVTTVSLPSGSIPVFVHTTENGTVYVANFGNNTNVPPTPPTVAAISTVANVVTNNITLGFSPIALAETPDGKKVYAVGGSNGAVSINTIGKTLNPPISDSSLVSPVWVTTRSDSQRAYILNQGSGIVIVIDTFSDAVLGSVSVGVGANFMLYDAKLNRLYVPNPAAGTVSILDASTDPPNVLATISLTAAPDKQCVTGACPVSVTALADGSRAYVASYQVSSSPCLAGQLCSITSQVTVINASSNTISSVIPLGTVSVDTVDDTGCNPATSTHPARFRLSVTSSGDSSRVYVANCDAGSTAIIHTSNDQLMLNLPAPLSDFPTQNGANPLPQNPVFVLAGP